jgi:pimeloyl-ACP methyl ester carboxylesterase
VPVPRSPSLLPERAETFAVNTDDGLTLAGYGLVGGRCDGPALLWGHANGFAAGCYLPFLDALGDRFQVFAYDARGHGGSEVPDRLDSASLHIDRHVRDLAQVAAAVRQRIATRPLYFASHSFTGVVALRLAGVFGIQPWTAMTVFEPPMTPPPELPDHAVAVAKSWDLMARAGRRRRRWKDPDAYAQALVDRPAFARFRPDMLAAYCGASLQAEGEGEWGLRCQPEVEALIYMTVLNPSTWRALPRVRLPVHFVAGESDPEATGSWAASVQAKAAATVPGGRLSLVANAGHMLMFEEPEICRDMAFAMLDEAPRDQPRRAD